jgi:FkbM family methyltransferase
MTNKGKFFNGAWFPEREEHMIEWIKTNRFGNTIYQEYKNDTAIKYQPQDRRRVYVDIGGHCGLVAMCLAPLFDKVVAFEPIPDHQDLFRRNMARFDNWELFPYALGAEAKSDVVMSLHPTSTGSTHIASDRDVAWCKLQKLAPYEAVTGIEMRTLDSFELSDVDLIKIDVEGYEYPIVRGAQKTLMRCKPNLMIEQKGHAGRFYGRTQTAATDWLKTLGYEELQVLSGDHYLQFGAVGI